VSARRGKGPAEEITGRVSHLFHESDGFTAGVLTDADGGEVRFKMFSRVAKGERIVATGRWIDDPRWGPQFAIESFSFDEALDATALTEFLARSDAFAGIGPVRARRIVNAVGADNFEDAIRERPAMVAEIAKVPVDVVEALAAEWFERRDSNRARAALQAYGVSPRKAEALIRRFGAGVIRTIESNPYWLLGRVRGLGFKTIDAYAKEAGVDHHHPDRIRYGILHLVSESQRDGHTWIPHAVLVRDAEELLKLDDLAADRTIAEHVAWLASPESLPDNWVHSKLGCAVGGGRLVHLVEHGDGGGAVFDRGLLLDELYVEDSLRRATPGDDDDESRDAFTAARALATEIEPRLNAEQADAVACGLVSPISVWTGGAGVGKTFTIATLVAAARRRGLAFRLCAPTGKAARRIEESVGQQASTIHKLLEPQVETTEDGEVHFTFGRDAGCPLECDLLVVDEVSMVDSRLMASLLRAVDGRRTRVVLVGDKNQLPPVGPGNVLRDVIANDTVPVVELTEVLRQAGDLATNTNAILDGVVAPTKRSDPAADGQQVEPWYVFDGFGDHAALRAFVVRLIEDRLASYVVDLPCGGPLASNGGLHECRRCGQVYAGGMSVDRCGVRGVRALDPIWDCQLLTPQHAGPIGTIALNRLVQEAVQRRHGRTPRDVKDGQRSRPMVDDKVIWTKNDYQLGVMNGTIGRVVDVHDKGDVAFVVDFEGEGAIEVPREKGGLLQLAYVLTIHKVQGSQFPFVLTVCHGSHSFMHHRGLFYTAVSRASLSSMVVGDAFGIRNCVSRIVSDDRRSLPSMDPDAAVLRSVIAPAGVPADGGDVDDEDDGSAAATVVD
jgi:exodeoxyribonuclease V alpha subunit